MKDYYTITEASEYLGVTRQAVYVCIKNGRIKAEMMGGLWTIKDVDLMFWKENKYNHNLRKNEGQYLFDNIKTFSAPQAAKLISEKLNTKFTEQRLYYLLSRGAIKQHLFGKTKIIKIEDIEKFIKKEKKLLEFYNLA